MQDISKSFILTSQPLSFYRSSSLDLWPSLTIEALDSCSMSCSSATAVPAHMIEVCTSSPSRLNWLCFLVPCVSALVWCSLQHCFYKPNSKFLQLCFEGEGVWKAEHNPGVRPMYNHCNNSVLNILNMVMSATSFCFKCPPLQMPYLPFKSSVKRTLVLT